jgi:hypothetical protein
MISSKRLAVLAVVAAAVFSWPKPACAQAGTSPSGAQEAAPAPLQAGFHDGFFIQTADGDTRLNFGMVAQADGRFVVDPAVPFTDTFLIRKARPTFTGQIVKYFAF